MIWDTSLYNAGLWQIWFSNILQKVMSLNEITAVKSLDISFHTTVFNIFPDDNIVPYFLSFTMEHKKNN